MTRHRLALTLAIWAGIALLAAIAVTGQLMIRRNFQLWEVDQPYREVVYLEPGGSVSQLIDTRIGDVAGFAVLVRPSNELRPASVNMRIRRSGGDRTILREFGQITVGPNHQGLAAIPYPPIPANDGASFEFEIEVAADSQGGLVILGTNDLDEIPPRQLTINGAPALPNLRALISPIVSVSTWAMVRGTFAFDPIRSALYLLVIALGSATGIVFGALALRRVSGATTTILPFIALLPVGVVLILTAATASFAVQFGEEYRSALTGAYWNTALAYSWLISVAFLIIWLLILWARPRYFPDLMWRVRLGPEKMWQPLIVAAVAVLGMSVGFALLDADRAGNVLGALAEILFGLALLLRIAASVRSTE